MNKEQIIELVNSLVNTNSVYAIKVAKVQVRKATVGEEIMSILKDGTVETPKPHICVDGDVIVTNPGGEVYVNSSDEFTKRYNYTEGEDFAIAKANVRRLVDVPAEELPITFPAPWGGEMTLENGYLNFDDMNGIYCIGRNEFNETHKITDENGNIL